MLIKDPERLERLLMFIWRQRTSKGGKVIWQDYDDYSSDPEEKKKEAFILNALDEMETGARNKTIFDMLIALDTISNIEGIAKTLQKESQENSKLVMEMLKVK